MYISEYLKLKLYSQAFEIKYEYLLPQGDKTKLSFGTVDKDGLLEFFESYL